MFTKLGPFWQLCNVPESEDSESVCPSENNVDFRAVEDSQQVVTAGGEARSSSRLEEGPMVKT